MDSNIVFVKSYRQGWGIVEFYNEIQKHPEISQNFLIARFDAINVRDYLREYIAANGISSLFNFTLTCDAVTHPGIHVDEIEGVVIDFVKKLQGVKNLFIIDPYFYSDDSKCVALFGRMISVLAERLESITFFTNGKTISKRAAMHSILSEIAPDVVVSDVVTHEFHDRFWIDATKRTGIVMGTSLNGIGKKIALVDQLSGIDAGTIADLAYRLIEPNEHRSD